MRRRTFFWAIVLVLTLMAPGAVHSVSAAPPIVPPESTSTLIEDVTFDSGSVDIWGPAAAGQSWQLINAEWDEGGATSQTTNVVGAVDFDFDIDGCDDDLAYCISHTDEFVTLIPSRAKIGFDSDASVAGHVRLSAETTNIQGTAEITYPGTATIDYPSVDSFLAGQTVNLGGDWTLGAEATIDANESGGDLQLDGDFRVAGELEVTGYYPFSSDSATIFDVDGSDEVTLFALTAFDGTPAVAPLPILGFGGSGGPFSVKPDDVSVHPDGVITAEGTDKFSDFVFDLDAIMASPLYGIGAPTLGANMNLKSLGVPLDLVLGYDIFDADAHVDFTASQTLTFNPSISIKLSFAPPPADITGPYESKAPDNSWVIFAPGEQVGVEFPPGRRDPIDVAPQVLLDSTLHNQTSLGTNSFIQLKAGRFDYQIPNFEIFPEFGPFDTGLDYPHPHGFTEFHDLICEDCIFHTHTTIDHHNSICFPCSLHSHDGVIKYHHPHVSTEFHDEVICRACVPHFHEVFIDLHDINIGPWGPWGFPGLDVSQEPVWGPEDYAESAGPPAGLADETLDLPFTPISLSTFQLEPNDPPLADPGGPYSVNEGSVVELSALASSDEEGDPMTFAWDLDDDGQFDDGSTVVIDFPGVDGPATHTVRVEVCDPYQCTEASTTVHVLNVTPATSASPDTHSIYSTLWHSVTATFGDPGTLDTHSATIDWDDGTLAESVPVLQGVGLGSLSSTHQYFVPGAYDIEVCVTDDDGGTGCDTVELVVRPVPVLIDIKPGSDPNSINLRKKGNLPVGVFTGTYEGFWLDALAIVPESVVLAGASNLGIGQSGEDLNDDDNFDRVFHIDVPSLDLDADSTQACLTGHTSDGLHFEGCDSVRIVPSKK